MIKQILYVDIPPPAPFVDVTKKYDASIDGFYLIYCTALSNALDFDNPDMRVNDCIVTTGGTGGLKMYIPNVKDEDATNHMDIYIRSRYVDRYPYGETFIPEEQLPLQLFFTTGYTPYKDGKYYYRIKFTHELDSSLYKEIGVCSCY